MGGGNLFWNNSFQSLILALLSQRFYVNTQMVFAKDNSNFAQKLLLFL